MTEIPTLIDDIKKDRDNRQFTEQGWDPIVMLSRNAKILIIGQAPGIKTQLEKTVFKDQSGDRLRSWLGVDSETFYDSGLIAVLPMNFYFPGHGKSGDLPPRKSFADKWHSQCLGLMPHVELTILIGMYAQNYYLNDSGFKTVTENVGHYQSFLPKYFPLIHPSPRNQIWIKKHPEFEETIIPELRRRVAKILDTQ